MIRNTIKDPNTWKALEKLPPLYATDEMTGDRPAVKLFDSRGGAFWVMWEYDPDTKHAFGYGELGNGPGELGYVDLNEIAELGIRIERDVYSKTMVSGYESRSVDVPEYLLV